MIVVAFQGWPSLLYNSTCNAMFACACMQVWSTKGGWAKPDLPYHLLWPCGMQRCPHFRHLKEYIILFEVAKIRSSLSTSTWALFLQVYKLTGTMPSNNFGVRVKWLIVYFGRHIFVLQLVLFQVVLILHIMTCIQQPLNNGQMDAGPMVTILSDPHTSEIAMYKRVFMLACLLVCDWLWYKKFTSNLQDPECYNWRPLPAFWIIYPGETFRALLADKEIPVAPTQPAERW